MKQSHLLLEGNRGACQDRCDSVCGTSSPDACIRGSQAHEAGHEGELGEEYKNRAREEWKSKRVKGRQNEEMRVGDAIKKRGRKYVDQNDVY